MELKSPRRKGVGDSVIARHERLSRDERFAIGHFDQENATQSAADFRTSTVLADHSDQHVTHFGLYVERYAVGREPVIRRVPNPSGNRSH